LQQDRAELVRFAERFGGEPEESPHFVANLFGQVFRIDARRKRFGKHVANGARKPRDVGRVPRHERVCLEIEGEVALRSLDPALRGLAIRNGVEAHVRFDHRKA